MTNRPYKVVVLERPIIVGSGRNEKRYPAITIRQPIARDLSKAARAKTTVDAVLVLIAGTSGLPMSVVEQLSEPDFKECIEFYDAIGSVNLTAVSSNSTPVPGTGAGNEISQADRDFGLAAAHDMRPSVIHR
ncbi:phage tail assembly protein [Ralstonia solanacearum]|uniref:phage tail assembly protein n=1 Tax=Ralstonia solanacearum TaxID=305 RepID=UPI0001D952CE|nr:phage tail assembly protein [Ralstonia solanacearum]CBJ50352.1 hypothethical protein [Ralstonia solanacearum PSI07]